MVRHAAPARAATVRTWFQAVHDDKRRKGEKDSRDKTAAERRTKRQDEEQTSQVSGCARRQPGCSSAPCRTVEKRPLRRMPDEAGAVGVSRRPDERSGGQTGNPYVGGESAPRRRDRNSEAVVPRRVSPCATSLRRSRAAVAGVRASPAAGPRQGPGARRAARGVRLKTHPQASRSAEALFRHCGTQPPGPHMIPVRLSDHPSRSRPREARAEGGFFRAQPEAPGP